MARASIRSLATWSVRLLVVVAIVQVLSALALWTTDAGRALLSFDPNAPVGFSAAELTFAALSVLGALPTIALVVVFLIWFHRCHVQLGGLGRSAELPSTPGMAVGWWFIPVANLWMPLREVRGLFRASSADRSRPDDPPTYLLTWWATFILVPFVNGTIGFVGSMRTMFERGLGAPIEPTGAQALLGVVSTVSLVIAAVLAVRLVRELTERVDQRAEEAGLR